MFIEHWIGSEPKENSDLQFSEIFSEIVKFQSFAFFRSLSERFGLKQNVITVNICCTDF